MRAVEKACSRKGVRLKRRAVEKVCSRKGVQSKRRAVEKACSRKGVQSKRRTVKKACARKGVRYKRRALEKGCAIKGVRSKKAFLLATIFNRFIAVGICHTWFQTWTIREAFQALTTFQITLTFWQACFFMVITTEVFLAFWVHFRTSL